MASELQHCVETDSWLGHGDARWLSPSNIHRIDWLRLRPCNMRMLKGTVLARSDSVSLHKPVDTDLCHCHRHE